MTFPTTPKLGLPLVPDLNDDWGQVMRDAMTILDDLARERVTTTVATGTLAAGAYETLPITLAEATDILTVATDYPAEVRLYNTAAARTADLSRLTITPPLAGNGLVCQNTTAAGALSINQDPVETFANHDGTISTTGYLTVWNRDTVSRVITVTIGHYPLNLNGAGGTDGTITAVVAGTGLTGGGTTGSVTLAVTYGTTAGTACQGNDARLSNARTPTTHNQALSTITTSAAAGVLMKSDGSALAPSTVTEANVSANNAKVTFPGFGTTGATACVGNDARLSDARPAAGGTSADSNQLLGATWASPSGIGSGTPSTGKFTTIESTTSSQFSNRILLSGQEFYQAANTSTDGVAIRLGVNRTNNRQLWITDSAYATNATSPTFRIGISSVSVPATGAYIGCLSTDGSAILPLWVSSPTTFSSTVKISDTTDCTAANTGGIQAACGAYFAKSTLTAGVASLQGGLQFKRTTASNANTTGAATDVMVVQIGTMSAARTHTLPAANTLRAGQIMWFVDESGTVGATNTWAITRAGADTIEGGTAITLNSAYAHCCLQCDGVSKFTRLSA